MKNSNEMLIKGHLLAFFLFFISSSFACTAFVLKTDQGVVTGRSLDYSQPSVYDTQVFKIGDTIQSVYVDVLSDTKYSWKVKHEFITVNNVLSEPKNYRVAFEGMNKAGISISGNLATADYPMEDESWPTISSDDIVCYILAQASSLEEVKNLFSNINIVSYWQYHYIVFDRKGNSLVVEFVDGKPKFFNNETPIITNNPGLEFHLSNLNNFANLKNYNFESITASSGNQFHGAGMFGLPGDWMSTARFIRGYFMIKEGQNYINNIKEALSLAAKIINSVSLIKGIDLGQSEIADPIYTQLQVLKDVENNKIYLKGYKDLDWTVVSY